jgi:hypothetical protein
MNDYDKVRAALVACTCASMRREFEGKNQTVPQQYSRRQYREPPLCPRCQAIEALLEIAAHDERRSAAWYGQQSAFLRQGAR